MTHQGDIRTTLGGAQAAPSHADDAPHEVKATPTVAPHSVDECIALAKQLGPLSPEERTAFRSQVAAVRHEDEAARAGDSPQAALDLAA